MNERTPTPPLQGRWPSAARSEGLEEFGNNISRLIVVKSVNPSVTYGDSSPTRGAFAPFITMTNR